MFKISDHLITSPVILAPMAGVTDAPYRHLAHLQGVGYSVSEMILANSQYNKSAGFADELAAHNQSFSGTASPLVLEAAGLSLSANSAKSNSTRVNDATNSYQPQDDYSQVDFNALATNAHAQRALLVLAGFRQAEAAADKVRKQFQQKLDAAVANAYSQEATEEHAKLKYVARQAYSQLNRLLKQATAQAAIALVLAETADSDQTRGQKAETPTIQGQTLKNKNQKRQPLHQQTLKQQALKQPRVIQLLGYDPEVLADLARKLTEANACDIIDINMGCPAKKVVKKAAGSALLADEALVRQILESVVGATHLPVTLKIRTGVAQDARNAITVGKMAQDVGIKALTVHGRTRADLFNGLAEYSTIRALKANLGIPVIANGDITSVTKAHLVREYTQADAVMLGRISQGNPWLVGRIASSFLATQVEQKLQSYAEYFRPQPQQPHNQPQQPHNQTSSQSNNQDSYQARLLEYFLGTDITNQVQVEINSALTAQSGQNLVEQHSLADLRTWLGHYQEPTVLQKWDTLIYHLDMMGQTYPETAAVRLNRKHFIWYLEHLFPAAYPSKTRNNLEAGSSSCSVMVRGLKVDDFAELQQYTRENHTLQKYNFQEQTRQKHTLHNHTPDQRAPSPSLVPNYGDILAVPPRKIEGFDDAIANYQDRMAQMGMSEVFEQSGKQNITIDQLAADAPELAVENFINTTKGQAQPWLLDTAIVDSSNGVVISPTGYLEELRASDAHVKNTLKAIDKLAKQTYKPAKQSNDSEVQARQSVNQTYESAAQTNEPKPQACEDAKQPHNQDNQSNSTGAEFDETLNVVNTYLEQNQTQPGSFFTGQSEQDFNQAMRELSDDLLRFTWGNALDEHTHQLRYEYNHTNLDDSRLALNCALAANPTLQAEVASWRSQFLKLNSLQEQLALLVTCRRFLANLTD